MRCIFHHSHLCSASTPLCHTCGKQLHPILPSPCQVLDMAAPKLQLFHTVYQPFALVPGRFQLAHPESVQTSPLLKTGGVGKVQMSAGLYRPLFWSNERKQPFLQSVHLSSAPLAHTFLQVGFQLFLSDTLDLKCYDHHHWDGKSGLLRLWVGSHMPLRQTSEQYPESAQVCSLCPPQDWWPSCTRLTRAEQPHS